jgi:hypothetical protein
MPYIKELLDKRWIVYSDIGNYSGLLIKDNMDTSYLYYNKKDDVSAESQITRFANHIELCKYFGEDITLNEINKKSNQNGGVISEIKGYPLNFNTPIIVEHETLPLFKKSLNSNVIYCAGFYTVKGPEGWRKSFCPKKVTLDSIEAYDGPFVSELEMISVLNIKKKDYD